MNIPVVPRVIAFLKSNALPVIGLAVAFIVGGAVENKLDVLPNGSTPVAVLEATCDSQVVEDIPTHFSSMDEVTITAPWIRTAEF